MAKPGPKRLPEDQKKLRGTSQPCRETERVVESVESDLSKPDWFRKGSLEHKIWNAKIDLFERRHLDISGCVSALAQYVALEAELIMMRRKKIDIPTSKINAWHSLASAFYDTPSAQQLKATKGKRTTFGAKDNGPPPPPGVS